MGKVEKGGVSSLKVTVVNPVDLLYILYEWQLLHAILMPTMLCDCKVGCRT